MLVQTPTKTRELEDSANMSSNQCCINSMVHPSWIRTIRALLLTLKYCTAGQILFELMRANLQLPIRPFLASDLITYKL